MEKRSLPISAEHREFIVKVAGAAVGREHQLLEVAVSKRANRISSARLVYLDGAPASGDFPLSNAGTFDPGAEVEILAGPNSNLSSLFKGIVVRQSIKIREGSAPQLIIECRHRAVKLTVGRKNAYFLDQTDADVITKLLEDAGIEADVESTSVSHKQLVQFCSTDWDFIVTRAETNGKLIFTNTDRVTIKKPAIGSAICSLLFGATILELDAEADALLQFAVIKGKTWDQAQQEVVEKEAADPGFAGPGSFSNSQLADVAGLDVLPLQDGQLSAEEIQSWADAAWLRSRLSKLTGRIKCEGIGTVNPGDTVTLRGVGAKYEGDVLVTGIHQQYDLVQGWKTHIGFGATDRWFHEEHGVSAPQASGIIPGINGLQVGVVISNEDPDGEYRVQVRMPLVDPSSDGTWVRVALSDAGDKRGLFFRPEIGDEVVLGFLNDDPRQGVILGMLHSSKKTAPLEPSDDNHQKGYQSRSEIQLLFDDDKKVLTLKTPGGNSIVLSEEDKGITLTDQNGNKILMNQDGIAIESSKALCAKGGAEIKLESGSSFVIKGGADLKLEGTSGAELSSSATTTVKGSTVLIN